MKSQLFTKRALFVCVLLMALLVPGVAQTDNLTDVTLPAATPADVEYVALVGRIGGASRAIAVQGNYAYVGEGPSLTILDISAPASPTVVGKTPSLPDIVRGVAIAGNYAYVADGKHGLRVVDISIPAEPEEVGFSNTFGYAEDVAVAGNYAYVAVGGGLRVIDISTPTSPMEVGFCDTKGAIGVAVAGSYAYVANGDDLRIVDVSTPSSPKEVGAYDIPNNFTRDVAVAGNYAYVAAYRAGLRILDISTPDHPWEAGSYNTPCLAEDVAVAGSYAYVADGDVLRVIDVSNPHAPTEAGFSPGGASAVAVAGSYAYVIASWNDGLRVVDVSTPNNPSEVGFYDAPRKIYGVTVAGDYAYVVEWNYGSYGDLWVVDISTRARPEVVGFNDTPVGAKNVTVAGNYAYVADDSSLRVIDISNPTMPVEVGFSPGGALDVAIVGDYAYVATGNAGLRVVDVSTPADPREVGTCDTPGSAGSVAVAGHYAYIADGMAGLRVIDVSVPASPTKVSSYDVPGEAVDVAIAGDYAYIAEAQVWDGSQYIGGGLQVVNISTPADPTAVGFYRTPGDARSVVVDGDYAYVAEIPRWDGSQYVGGGLRVMDVVAPIHPKEVDFCPTPGQASSVAVAGSHIYVADEEGGLVIFQFPPSTSASISTSGGTLVSVFDQTTYSFPAGTFSDTVVITHTLHLPGKTPSTDNKVGIGHFFDLKAVYSDTGQPAQPKPGQTYTITVQYTDAERGPAIEDTLGLYNWDGNAWSQGGIVSSVDAASNRVVAQVSHCSLFAVLGETRRTFLLLVFRND